MRTKTSLSAGLLAIVLVLGSALGGPPPASADDGTFANPLATPATTDLDITAVHVERTPTTMEVVIDTQNLPVSDHDVDVYFMREDKAAGDPTMDRVHYSYSTDGVHSALNRYYRPANGTESLASTNLGHSTTAAGQITFTGVPSDIPWNGDMWVAVQVSSNGKFGVAGRGVVSNGVTGFGPLNGLSIPTTVGVGLSSAQQVFQRTSATARVAVSPATAPGTVSLYDGSTAIATSPVANGVATFSVPNTLAIGAHGLRAVFTPTTARFAIGTSPTTALQVLDPDAPPPTSALTATRTKLRLSHDHARVTVKVSHHPAGAVRLLLDGKRQLKLLTLKHGRADWRLPAKLDHGRHALTATFVPPAGSTFAASTSTKLRLRAR